MCPSAITPPSKRQWIHAWDRMGALKPGRRIAVRPFKGMGSKVVGDYVSSDDAGIVVRTKGGQEVAIAKERIREVVKRRWMRYAILIGTAVGASIRGGRLRE